MTGRQSMGEAEQNARQKADLVYRTRQALEKRFEKIEEIPRLMDILTDKALEKIDLPNKISIILKLAVEMIKRYGPLTIDNNGQIVKKYSVVSDVRITDVGGNVEAAKNADIIMKFSRTATDEEFRLRNDILNHICELKQLITPGMESHNYTFQELDEKVLSPLKKDANAKGMKYQINTESITYWCHPETEDVTKADGTK